MTDRKKYEEPRPSIPADIRRAVEVESGHACAIKRCGEHTYLEIHHINENRQDNRVENLILLCDKHHKMAHAGVIDRKSLDEYKAELRESYRTTLHNRVEQLERLVQQLAKVDIVPEVSVSEKPNPDLAQKDVAFRPQVMAYTLEQLAVAKFERERGYFFDRGVRYRKEGTTLELDALRQDDSSSGDVIVEVRWIRKRYLDSHIHVKQIDAKVAVYELMTGRKARGVLILVVPKDDWKKIESLSEAARGLAESDRKPEIIIYSYDDLGFDPGPVSAGLFTENTNHTRTSSIR